MNTLWTFGDSMTFGHGCNEACHSNFKEEYLLYKKEDDTIWPNHLGKLLNYKVNNLGKNGCSNDYIFGILIDNFDNIKENDVVIINMTLHGRIDIPYKDKLYRSPASYELVNLKKGQTYDDIKSMWIGGEFDDMDSEMVETIINFQYYFSDNPYYKEQNIKRFEFLKERIIKEKKVKFCFLWGLEESNDILITFENIFQHTNGKIRDTHFSWNGHREFAHYLHALTDKSKLI